MQNKATQIRVSFNNDILTALIRVAKSLDMTNATLIKAIVAQDKRIIREINRINEPEPLPVAEPLIKKEPKGPYVKKATREERFTKKLEDEHVKQADFGPGYVAELARNIELGQQHDEDMMDL